MNLITDPLLRSELSELERFRTQLDVDLEYLATTHLHLFDPVILRSFDMGVFADPRDTSPLPFTEWDLPKTRAIRNILIEKLGWSHGIAARLDRLVTQLGTVFESSRLGPQRMPTL